MLSFLLGWISLLGVVISSFLYFWNILIPLQNEKRIKFHCYLGVTSFLPTIYHIFLLYPRGFSNESMIKLGLFLYLIIIGSGVILLYLPGTGKIRYQARSFHPALVIGLVIILLYHVLNV